MKRYVVVSGLPASGKSTVARTVAEGLSLPLFDKDAFLEALFENVAVGDVRTRRSLSLQADQAFQREALLANGGVLATWWKHPSSLRSSGTAIEWLTALPCLVVEVHCICSAAVAAKRFVERKRHAGHLDGRWSDAELLANFREQALLGPLRIGRLIEVRTEGTFEASDLVRQIEQAFEKARHEQ